MSIKVNNHLVVRHSLGPRPISKLHIMSDQAQDRDHCHSLSSRL